jgi:hypothetical protein
LSHTLKNGYTSPLCWLATALPAAWAVVFAENTPMLIAAVAVLIFFYSAVYARLSQFGWCFSARTLRPIFTKSLT